VRDSQVDPSRIGVVGSSSGGHLAALVGTTDGVTEFEGGSNPGFSSAVQAVVAFNPELDLVALWLNGDGAVIGVIEQFLGENCRSDPALWARASPLSHVDAGSAPFLLLHGTADQQVPYTQSVMMRDALIEEGVHAELFTAEGAEHGFLNRPLWQNPSLEAMKDFFTRMLR
jgi:dipeptidyl aminopeptidase/acylaminoacyl peptidase